MITIDCTIDGEPYSPAQLDRLRYTRNLHVLHQLKRLGATIKQTDDEIDRLSPAQAHELNVATRLAHGRDGLRKLFADQLAQSDLMWKNLTTASQGQPLRAARADLTVTGMTIDDFHALLTDFGRLESVVVQANPDHFYFQPLGAGAAYAMETFGMYGVPSDLMVASDRTIPAPVAIDDGFHLLLAGTSKLASDNTPIDVIAYHQSRSLPQGFQIKLCALFPARTPAELVDGHALHLAVEFGATLAIIAANAGTADSARPTSTNML
ncbi:hypothetical protein [Mangrovihabitans endophyticus]|uniref:Uncharacterized protein n=1 Tax=Mangrovihabitans endophyticus TaxID=1751298 RepID=A0A8J3BY59_9ACTN|nr:hypothetical protein [Mangrovihabitans endophyticus]GGK79167.1 hypothetical protein GCM10012284_11460 [Mangrovihabitans endophyticus]